MDESISLFVRTLVIYLFILITFRLMGQREIAKLTIFDLVVIIMIAEVSTISLEDTNKPIWYAMIPIGTLILIQMGMSFISLKSKSIRDLVDGKPVVLIKHGQAQDKEMKRHRYTLNDLMIQLREKNVFDVADVEMAILEPSGNLNVLPKANKQPVTREDMKMFVPHEGLAIPLIMDGQVINHNLEKLGLNQFWLKNMVQKQGYRDFKEVFLASMNQTGNLYIDAKDPKPDPHPTIE